MSVTTASVLMRTQERCVEVRPADHVHHIVSMHAASHLFGLVSHSSFLRSFHSKSRGLKNYGNGLFCAILKFESPPREHKRDKAVKKRRDIIK